MWTGIFLFAGVCCLFLFWPISNAALSDEGVTSTRILDVNGELLREIRPEGRGHPLPPNAIPSFVFDAVISIEDQHFYRHFGINPFSMLSALRDNLAAGDIVRGGSTLTMQVARALRGYQSRTLYQKVAEVLLAFRLEAQLSKQEILTLWLNKVYFGNRAYGIEAASQTYFGKSAIDLSEAESAFLAGLPQRPSAFDPFRHFEAAKKRQLRVIDAMAAANHISHNEAYAIKLLPLSLSPPSKSFQAPHFVEYIRQITADTLHKTTEIRTPLHLSLQRDLEAIVSAHLERLSNDGVGNAAALVIENATGNVVSYVGSADFWDASIFGQNDGVQMLRQPGSALKPFTYALALDTRKYTPASILPDIEVHVPEGGGAFSPQNYDKTFHGPVPFRTALASSYNVPAVRLLRELDPASLLTTLQSAGITSLNKGPEHYGVGLTLGNGEVRLFELARAYAMLARGGTLPQLNVMLSTTNLQGETSFIGGSNENGQLLDPAIAHLITDMLADPEARSPAFGRYGPLELPFPVAVKTGTSKDYRDNWAVGFTPAHTVAVWVGNFDGQSMRRVSGVSGAGPLFNAIMQRLGPGGHFEQPDGLETAMICPISGALPSHACPTKRSEVFLHGTVPAETCPYHRVFRVDTRDGTLAIDDTPASFVEEQLFTVYPDEYTDWARSNGLSHPPEPQRTTSPSAMLFTSSEEPAQQVLKIMFPKPGMTFQIDPVLQPEYQRIKLNGTSQLDGKAPVWWIDDSPLQEAFWTLKPGVHTITLRSTSESGSTISSEPVIIRVLPATEAPAETQPSR